MKLYLDTADVSRWKLPAGCPAIRGVTTNPTLVHAAGLAVDLPTYLALVHKAGSESMPELMLQLPRAELREVHEWLDQLVPACHSSGVKLTVKLPCHPDWQPTLALVQSKDLSTLLTGVSNPVQLLWARQHGATYIAPYVGRLQADGRDVWSFLEACVAVQSDGPKLLAASIRSADVLSKLIAMSAYAATVRPEFAANLATDALTDSAIAQFEADTRSSMEAK